MNKEKGEREGGGGGGGGGGGESETKRVEDAVQVRKKSMQSSVSR